MIRRPPRSTLDRSSAASVCIRDRYGTCYFFQMYFLCFHTISLFNIQYQNSCFSCHFTCMYFFSHGKRICRNPQGTESSRISCVLSSTVSTHFSSCSSKRPVRVTKLCRNPFSDVPFILSLIHILRAHETKANLVCRLLLEKKKKKKKKKKNKKKKKKK